MKFSLIIPLYNRPQEIDELLDSLTLQSEQDFEVLVVEDGSTDAAESVVRSYSDRLNIRYFVKENTRQGFTRNYGFERAQGDWFVVFDSDCIIPPDYFRSVRLFLESHPEIDAYGGPDAASPDFSSIQKAISYSMTSPFTTGGIRGGKRNVGTYHPRSFNMGISRKAWDVTQGYRISVKGEDVEFSVRILDHGLKTALIAEAFVYHKRRTSFSQFRSQVEFFGRARLNIRKFYPGELKPIHWMPTLFSLYAIVCLVGFILFPVYLKVLIALPLLIWSIAIVSHATYSNRSLMIGVLAWWAGICQLSAYGWGLFTEYFHVVVLRKRNPTIGTIKDVPLPLRS